MKSNDNAGGRLPPLNAAAFEAGRFRRAEEEFAAVAQDVPGWPSSFDRLPFRRYGAASIDRQRKKSAENLAADRCV
jgi:hypothetical protein